MQKEEGANDRKKQKALSVSIKEGCAAGVSSSIGETYITPMALAVNTQPLQIGFLNSIPGIAGPLAQLFGSKLMESLSRKKIVMLFVLMQALLWIPIGLLAVLVHFNILTSNAPIYLIIAYTIVVIAGSVAHPAWFSWMGDLVPASDRGKYFSLRNRAIGTTGLVTVLAGAFMLDLFKTQGYILLGFALLFAIASTSRMISYILLGKQYSPKFRVLKRDYFSFWQFMKKMDNYGKFSIYLAFFNGAIMIASPFFAVYMLQYLKFSYVTFMIISISSTVVYLLSIPIAGKFSDRYGNVKLMHVANVLFILTPILWIFIKNPFWLIGIPQVISGLANAAFIIAATNFNYDAVSPEKRGLCVSYNNILVGAGMFIGPIIGGLIVNYYHPSALNPYLFLFGVAAFFRLVVGLIFLPGIKEVKKIKYIPNFSMEVTHPWKAIHNDVSWLKHIVK